MNTNYKIIPIFNQKAENVWPDFVRIAITCNKQLGYDGGKNGYNEQKILQNMEKDWKNKDYNFAFAAYQNTRMIGFAKGCLNTKYEMLFDNLYVLPEYQCMGVGTQLAKAVEYYSFIVAHKIVLTAFIESVMFWGKREYAVSGIGNAINMEKNVLGLRECVVPVFQWKPDIFCVKDDVGIKNSVFMENKYQPLFAYIGNTGNIDGVALRTKDNKNAIWLNYFSDNFYRGENLLMQVLSNYTR